MVKKFVQHAGNHLESARLEQAVVHIYSHVAQFNWSEPYKIREQAENFGTGFFIDDQGHIITNAHVVEQAREIQINIPALGRKALYASIVSFCPQQDLALLRLNDADREYLKKQSVGISFLPLGDSDTIMRTEPVLVLGYPLGQYNLKGSTGIVSGFESIEGNSLIQITAPINHGYSGGPLLNNEGDVVGIALAISALASNIGYAIPVNNLKTVFPDFFKHKLLLRPSLGITFSNTSDDEAAFLHNPVPGGLYINQVMPGSIADKMGLQAGDMIYAINGNSVDSFGQVVVAWSQDRVYLFDLLNRIETNAPLEITVWRKGTKITARGSFELINPTAITQVYPDYEPVDYEVFAGLVITPLTENHIDMLVENAPWLVLYDEPENQIKPALVISAVLPASQADMRESLSAGQVIDEVNGQPVSTLPELRTALKESKKTGFITIKTKQTVFAAFKLDKTVQEAQKLSQEFGYPLSKTMQELMS